MNIDQNTPTVAIVIEDEILTQEQYDAQRKDQLAKLHAQFSGQRDEWVKYRAQSGVERRWREAQALYYGDSDEVIDSEFVDALKNGVSSKSKNRQETRSRVVINIVRPKTDQAVARMCEILLPVDDRNWGIKPTPVPEAVAQMVGSQEPMLDEQGQPTGQTQDQAAQDITKRMKQCAEKMQSEIDDVLTQSSYNGEQRKMIEDAVRLGTGFMLGCFPMNSAKRQWVPSPDGTLQLVMGADVIPGSMRADPWDVFTDPACGSDHQRGQGFFHRRYATRKELRGLRGLPGYDENVIREVLREKPTRTKVSGGRIVRDLSDEDAYEMWVYYGQVEPDQMSMLSESMGDPLEDVENGVIVMIGEKIIGAMPSWIPDGSLPLDSWCWRKSDESPYGFGLPHELSNQQRVIIAAWRQVMDDAKFSIGGQLVMKKKMISPQDGNYAMYPGKVWLASDDLDDVRQAMHMFEFANHSQTLLGIANAAMQFADQETSMPQMLSGEKGQTAPETLGGMVMLSNNANTVLRLRVKLYDDSLTRPHLRRYYDWMMAHSPKNEIKGDMDVDARGSTALLEKDIQNQATINLAAVTNNPRYAAFLDPKEELKVILKAFKVNPDDIMLTDAKIEQNMQNAQQQPPDPRIQAAQIAADIKKMELQERAAQRDVDVQLSQDDMQIKREGIAYTTERERSDAEMQQVKLQMERELAIAKMQQDGQMTADELASKERLQSIKLSNDNALFNAEAALKVSQGSGI